MNIEDLFVRKCINALPTADQNGNCRLYRHPDLYQWAKEGYKRGEKYFYITPEDPKHPCDVALAEPEYRWFLKKDGLTDKEFEKLCNQSV